jgi:hypothetical protein
MPLRVLRLGVDDQPAKTPRSLQGPKSPPLVRASRGGTEHTQCPKNSYQDPANRPRSQVLALWGRWELRRRDRIGGVHSRLEMASI